MSRAFTRLPMGYNKSDLLSYYGKVALIVTLLELLPVFTNFAAENSHLSAPLYINENGPYYVGLTTQKKPWQVHLYEVMDSAAFLLHSVETPKYITTRLFVYKALKTMRFPARKALHEEWQLTLQRIVADAPACRRALARIAHTHPEIASYTYIMTECGSLLSAQELASHPDLLQ